MQPQKRPQVIGPPMDEPQQPGIDHIPPAARRLLIFLLGQHPCSFLGDLADEGADLPALGLGLHLVGQEVLQPLA